MPSSPVAERGRPPRRVARARRLGAGLALALALGACGGGPAPRLYVLEPDSAGPVTSRGDAPGALGIALVSLPGYARDARLASRAVGNEIELADGHRWAEDPDEALTRAFAERLRLHAGATVLAEPWPRNFAPDARVELFFDQLLREPSGGASAAGQIRLLSGDGRDVLESRPFRLAQPAVSDAPADWFGAVARLVDELARTAVDALGDAAPS